MTQEGIPGKDKRQRLAISKVAAAKEAIDALSDKKNFIQALINDLKSLTEDFVPNWSEANRNFISELDKLIDQLNFTDEMYSEKEFLKKIKQIREKINEAPEFRFADGKITDGRQNEPNDTPKQVFIQRLNHYCIDIYYPSLFSNRH